MIVLEHTIQITLQVGNVDSEGARITDIFAGGMPTDDADPLGSSGGSSFHEMGFTIEKSTVTAVSRALARNTL